MNRRTALDYRLRRALPKPVYRSTVRSYYYGRMQLERALGRGRLLPDFVIIGAARAGTTSLYAWLCDHPFAAPAKRKEVNYFDYNYYRGEGWYRTHFPTARERHEFAASHGRSFLTGEASPAYMSHEWAPQRLAALLPQVKLLVTLRDPVDRAHSQFQLSRREGQEPLESFGQAVAAEDERLASEIARMKFDRRYKSWPIGCWSYKLRSRYAEQLEKWFGLLPREQFHILTLEELAANPQATLDAVHEFLGLPAHRYEGIKTLHKASYDPIAPQVRAELNEYFRPMNERLYELVGRDLGWGRAARAEDPAGALRA